MRVPLDRVLPSSRAEALMWRALQWESPELPSPPADALRRLGTAGTWRPAGSLGLFRHVSKTTPHRVHSNSEHSPRGYTLESRVCLLLLEPMPATCRLTAERDLLRVVSIDDEPPVEQIVLGHAEAEPLPHQVPLEIWHLHDSGQQVLVADPEDEIRGIASRSETVGWVDLSPIAPKAAGGGTATWGLRVLSRRLDLAASRHAYAVGPPEDAAADGVRLGSLWHAAGPGFVALERTADGRLASALLAQADARRRTARTIASWIAAPFRWAPAGVATRASAGRARRLLHAPRGPATPAETLGWLRRDVAEGWHPLYSAEHPVVDDQLLTRSTREAMELGYAIAGVLGYVCDAHHDPQPPPGPDIPWAERFGRPAESR